MRELGNTIDVVRGDDDRRSSTRCITEHRIQIGSRLFVQTRMRFIQQPQLGTTYDE